MTYSSSSDDSEHEYVEPTSPIPEKRINSIGIKSILNQRKIPYDIGSNPR